MTPDLLRGWVPIRVWWDGDRPMTDWCYLGEERFTDPFFEQTIQRCMRRPFRVLFRRQTPMDVLADVADIADASGTVQHAAPSGFIFHMSRCGSTLVSQMLAAHPEHIVISEAGPIDAVLRAHLRDGRVTDDERVAWLRGLLGAYGAAHLGDARSPTRLFVKFDSWSILELPLIRAAFPEVPWVFVYRDPIEVLVSHERERGSQMLPGVLQPELFGLDWASAAALPLDEYSARVLEVICAQAVHQHEVGGGRLVEHTELPTAVWESICSYFDVPCTTEDVERMRSVATFHAKRPYERFTGDGEAKRAAANPRLQALALDLLEPWYQRLCALREGDHHGAARR